MAPTARSDYRLASQGKPGQGEARRAKAGKAWRPLKLPDQSGQLSGLAGDYQHALDRLSAALDAERRGELPPTAPREALERLLERAGGK